MVITCVLRSVASVRGSGLGSYCCRKLLYSTEYKNRYYTKKHEWVSVKDNIGTVGISNFAQDALGEVVFAQLPDAGGELAAGDECGALESVKAAGELYTPVSGTVTEKNTAVEEAPSLINKSCFEQGWLFRLRLCSPDEVQGLMDQAAYDKYLETQGDH